LKTGIVLELQSGKAIIMMNTREFITIPCQNGWKKGDIVQFNTNKRINLNFIHTLAACFVLTLLLGFSVNQIYFTQTSLVSIDVNPSIEISLNRFNRVISSKSFNQEGAEILSSIKLFHQDYSDALSLIINAEKKEGYMNKNGNIVVSVFTNSKKKQTAMSDVIKAKTATVLQSNIENCEVEYHEVDEQTVEQAHAQGVSAGKYYYLKQLLTVAPGIDITKYTHHSIEQLKEQISECKDEDRDSQPEGHDEDIQEHNHMHNEDAE
jgi:hypothetical protein